MLNGDYLLIENLHLEKEFLIELEQCIQKFQKETCHARFRLFLSISQVDYCPETILMSSIKVALQQPITIKMKIERHVEQLRKEGGFRRSLGN